MSDLEKDYYKPFDLYEDTEDLTNEPRFNLITIVLVIGVMIISFYTFI